MKTWCPQCGPDVRIDEDGCCQGCGADAVGAGADQAHKLRDMVLRMQQYVPENVLDELARS